MADAAATGEINTSGRVMFVRDADGELLVIKPGEPIPVVTPSVVDDTARAGEKEGFFSKDSHEDSSASARSRDQKPATKSIQPGGPLPPLLVAARTGDDDAVRAACQADEDAVKAKDHLERTALHLAAYAGHASTVELLLAFGARHSPLACDAITPLHFAAQSGHEQCCKLLLKAGAKVNARGTKRNDTPLHLCAFKGHLSCLSYLLKKNADALLKNKAGRTPMDVASTEEVKAALAEAANKKRPKEELAGPSACAAADDDDDGGEVDEPAAKQARM